MTTTHPAPTMGWLPALPTAVMACLLAAGCGSTQPARYYLLEDSPPSNRAGAASGELVLLIGPVHIPPHLERSHMALCSEGTEVVYDEYHRWAERIDAGILRVIRAELASLLPSATVSPFAWVRSVPFDYRIPIYILTFSGAPGKEARLSAQWAITTERGRRALVTRTSTFSTMPEDGSHDALVRAYSESVKQLGREMAIALNKLPAEPPEE